jgi:hypothetical protein
MSFKHYFNSHFTEAEVSKTLETLNESRWWGKFKEAATIIEYTTEEKKKRKFKAWKMEEGDCGPSYVVEARKGLRYGLWRTTENKFICARLKPGIKRIIKPKGVFKEVDGKLIFELRPAALAQALNKGGAQELGGGKELIQRSLDNRKNEFHPPAPKETQPKQTVQEAFSLAGGKKLSGDVKQGVAANAKAFDPEATLTGGRPNLDVRAGDGMQKTADAPFDPNATLRESSDEEIAQGINEYLSKVLGFDMRKIKNWWTVTDIEDIESLWAEKVKGWKASQQDGSKTTVDESVVSQKQLASVAQRISNYLIDNKLPNSVVHVRKQIDKLPHEFGTYGVEILDMVNALQKAAGRGEMTERRTNVEPCKSFPNGEKTYDKNTDEWNKGVYTDAKA